MSEQALAVAEATFEEEVLKANLPVLVDFWAPWCGPCKAIAPVLDKIAEKYQDRLKIVKMNIDENGDTPTQYEVRGIPTLMIFKSGEVAATQVGALTESQLTAFIDSNV